MRFLVYIVGIVLFFEAPSSLILHHVINPSRMERFNLIYKDFNGYAFTPHPFLSYTQPEYVSELKRYLEHFDLNEMGEIKGRKDEPDKILIVALGGSTTKRGYPKYSEQHLNNELARRNSSLEAVVFNFGVDGWSSVESTQNYFFVLKYLHPDFIVIHHNHNDGRVMNYLNQDGTLYYPEISSLDKGLVELSKTYKLLRFVYYTLYNPMMHGKMQAMKEVGVGQFNTNTRISSYLNAESPSPLFTDFFLRKYSNNDYPRLALPFIIREQYESLIRYSRADNSTIILTTQYQNFSHFPEGHPMRNGEAQSVSEEINAVIRDTSRNNNVPLVDLDRDMREYDYLQVDGTHFNEEGIKVKGELVGAALFEIIDMRYNLSGE